MPAPEISYEVLICKWSCSWDWESQCTWISMKQFAVCLSLQFTKCATCSC